MGLDYSYSQPSVSVEYGGNSGDTGYIEDLIRQDQAELGYIEEHIRQDEAEEHMGYIEEHIRQANVGYIEEHIRQAELRYSEGHIHQAHVVQYSPQPEVEFGFPQTCYCGARPFLATSNTRSNPGRRFYTCANVDDDDCHVWKWWDVAVMKEMGAMDRHVLQLAEKVDTLTYVNDLDTEQKLLELEKQVGALLRRNRG
ncbi:unnamed protein product [Eruca vesicaria subsp. sativa]|uniref:GRF-type domain-containing protein n=1 Tax=Eruca vesicaria subsp. sativa TaxID=29727 RepID=A0ABC8J319_ERUVS|nr:unnamed protein product [Eruca vesicaria subsp. sativa]